MRKKLGLLLALIVALVIAQPASASLYDYFNARGLKLPSVEERAPLADSCGIKDYTGSKMQNIALEACLELGSSEVLGATPTPTSSAARKYVETPDFFLYSPAVAGDTTITLNNLEDIYGNALTMDDFGTEGYGRIDPDGQSVSEAFTFTGVTANADGTYTLTGVSTVLAKYPYTRTSGLVRSHSINAIVRMTNTASFYDNFANKENDEIIDGIWNFYQFPIVSSTGYSGLPTSNGQLATKYYVDTVGAGGFTAANISPGRGLTAEGSSPERVGMAPSSTTGGDFDSSGKYYQAIDTTTGVKYSNFNGQTTTNTISQLTGTGDDAINTSVIFGQTIIPKGTKITTTTFYLRNSTSNSYTCTTSIYTSSANVPTGSAIASSTFTPTTTNTGSFLPYSVNLNATVTAGNSYAIVVTCNSATSQIRVKNSYENIYPYGVMTYTYNSGSLWSYDSDYDMVFSFIETGVPQYGIGINTSTLTALIATTTPTAGMMPIAGVSGTVNSGWIPQSLSFIPTSTNGYVLTSTSTGAFWDTTSHTLISSSTFTCSTAYPSPISTIASTTIPLGTKYAIIKGNGEQSSNGGTVSLIHFAGLFIDKNIYNLQVRDVYGGTPTQNYIEFNATWNTKLEIYFTGGTNPSNSGGGSGSGVIYFYK